MKLSRMFAANKMGRVAVAALALALIAQTAALAQLSTGYDIGRYCGPLNSTSNGDGTVTIDLPGFDNCIWIKCQYAHQDDPDPVAGINNCQANALKSAIAQLQVAG